MYQRPCFFALLMLSLPLFLPDVAHAAESYDNCTGFITSLPTTISTQGTWCLKQDLNTAITSGNAITVATNNVTIDCNNFKVGGLAAGAGTQAYGIFASDKVNITVRRCNIRGFFYGTAFGGALSGGHVIEGNRYNGNTFVAVSIRGDGSVVRGNVLIDTGGSTAAPSAEAIQAFNSVDVLDNSISGVAATTGGGDNAIGIYVGTSPAGSISGNRIHDLVKDGSGYTYGIYADNISGERMTLRDNDITAAASGNSYGMYCVNTAARAKNNVVGGFTTLMQGCGDAGGNDLVP